MIFIDRRNLSDPFFIVRMKSEPLSPRRFHPLESSKKPLFAFLFTQIPKMITQVFTPFQCISNRCNPFVICVIRDFWVFSKISYEMIDDHHLLSLPLTSPLDR